jgi:glycosidase
VRAIFLLFLVACDGSSPVDAGMDPPIDAGPIQAPDAGPPPPFVEDARWHRQVVFYELWVRSFQDSDGDGIGDFAGLTSRLDYLEELGVGGLWLMPTYPSPLADSGYDVADYVGVHPDYGTLEDFDTFLAAAHERDIHVFMDLVFNHTSTEHEWFQSSRSSAADPRADWFVWADEAGMPCNDVPDGPFGSARWAMDPVRGQFYFHQFYPAQPDLNFASNEVQEELLDVMRVWLDRGVDGFRLDVAHRYGEALPQCLHSPATYTFHERMRATLDEYPDRAIVAEVTGSADQIASYVGDDRIHMAFLLGEAAAFWLAVSQGTAQALGEVMGNFASIAPAGGTFATLLGNHDTPRAITQVGNDTGAMRVMAAAQLTMPGVPFVYYGEEIGVLAGSDAIVDQRDSARTPMQWDASANAGFTTGTPFLDLSPEHETRNVEVESADPDSLLAWYRQLIALRNDTPALRTGTFQLVPGQSRSVLAFWRRHPDGDRLVMINLDDDRDATVRAGMPDGVTVLTDTLSETEQGTITNGVWSATLPARTAWVLAL